MGLPPLLTPLNLPPVSSLARYFFTTPRSLIAPGALWKIAGITLAGALAIVARACGYDLGALLAYSAYFAAFVALPGVVLLWALNRRALSIARQSVVAGIGLSFIAMGFAALGYLTPVQGALLQEAIDVAVILNALRVLGGPAEGA